MPRRRTARSRSRSTSAARASPSRTPFFGGEGPDRTGCRLCGECLLGCPYGAKNQLTRNYLHLAERYGAEICAEHEVRSLVPLEGGGYEVHTRHPWRQAPARVIRARRVVLAGGVLGSLDLLFRCRDDLGTLPHVSTTLGSRVRTNSEALTAVLAPPGQDLSRGPTISSDFHPDEVTHVTQNRYMGGWHMRAQLGPMVDGEQLARRALATVGRIVRRPVAQTRVVGAKDFLRRLTVLTTMQHSDNELALQWRRSPVRPWRRVLRSRVADGVRPPSYLPVANAVTRAFAEASGGRPLNLLAESVGGLSVTAHVLGGAVMGADSSTGVVDDRHEVHGHPGLYVVDASVIPANLGVNPSPHHHRTGRALRHPVPRPARPSTRPAADRGVRGRDRPSRSAMTTTILDLRREWPRCRPLTHDDVVGDFEASFVAPLGRVAPRGLGLVGLPRWFGKRFTTAATTDTGAGEVRAVNLVRDAAVGLREVLPMRVAAGTSRTDGGPALVLTYAADAPRPWRWVRDELREAPDGTVVGMTFVDLPGLRRVGTPFLLTRVEA